MNDKPDYKVIYEMMDGVSPLPYDCGKLCGARCCRQDDSEEEMGMYLLPGEESMQDRKDPWLHWSEDRAEDYCFPSSWKGTVFFVICGGPEKCERKKRPVQCRTFPLMPYLTSDGKLQMILYGGDLPYTCPLLKKGTILNDDFSRVTFDAWEMLIKDRKIYDLVSQDSRMLDMSGVSRTIIYEA